MYLIVGARVDPVEKITVHETRWVLDGKVVNHPSHPITGEPLVEREIGRWRYKLADWVFDVMSPEASAGLPRGFVEDQRQLILDLGDAIEIDEESDVEGHGRLISCCGFYVFGVKIRDNKVYLDVSPNGLSKIGKRVGEALAALKVPDAVGVVDTMLVVGHPKSE
jgi:hypothetical protein